MPLLLYPLLSLIMNRLLLSNGLGAKSIAYRIGVASTEDGNQIIEAINIGRLSATSEFAQPLKILWSDRPHTTNSKAVVSNPVTESVSVPEASGSEAEVDVAGDVKNSARKPLSDFSIHLVEDGNLAGALKNESIDLIVQSNSSEQMAAPNDAGGYTPITFDIDFREGDPISENAVIELRRLFAYVNEVAAFRHRRYLDSRRHTHQDDC